MKKNFSYLASSITCAALASILLTGCLPQDQQGTTSSSAGNSAMGSDNPGFVVTPDNATPPSTSSDSVPTPSTPASTVDDSGYPVVDPDSVVTINNGANFTASTALDVLIRYPAEAIQMKISMNENCEGGSWEDFPYDVGEARRALTLPANQMNLRDTVSVQFKDYDFVSSGCFKKSITHDNLAPEVLFTKYPMASLQDGDTTQIIYEVIDAGVGVASVTCRLNSVSQACASGRATVNVPAMSPGNYTFEVVATDKFGQSIQKSVSWSVTSTLRTVTHNITVDEYRKWDILFVIDNSGSMEYEQQSMGSRTRNFLSVLQGLDWQIAVTTTDPNNIALGDGRFVPLTGMSGQYILNSSMNQTQAQTVLSNTLQRPETGSGSEQGIRAVYRAVERSQTSGNPNHTQFFRSSANFAVVLISDEDESANTTKNDPQNLMNLVHSTFSGQKNFLFNSIITVPGDTACRSTYGYSYGDRYKTLTELSGGLMGSVCASDYASQVTGIADKIRSMAKTFTLSCAPVAGTPITVTRNGVAVTESFVASGMQLVFSNPIEPGDYALTYKCLAQ